MSTVRQPKVDAAALRAGSERALIDAVIALFLDWCDVCGSSGRHPLQATRLLLSETPAHAALLSAALELRDLLAKSPQGRQALCDFGFQPFLEHIEGK